MSLRTCKVCNIASNFPDNKQSCCVSKGKRTGSGVSASMRAVIIGDTHFPYCNWKLLDRIIRKIDMIRPEYVFQMGDVYDLYCFSRYAKTLRITPDVEISTGRSEAEKMWQMVKEASPASKCFQLLGNHDDRLMNTVMSKAPELESVLRFLDVKKLWRFDGVETQTSSRDEIVERGIMFHHGHRSKLGDHMTFNQCNTVVGHSHHGGVVYKRLRDRTIWELNAGAVPDINAVPLRYTAQKLSNSVLGYGVIDEDGPRFIAL